ncbi:MAG: nucleotidyltransferase family protein [Vicinamibacterales bacterium]|jgi:CTP:molybdopterin cytidylyltransferase MocA|nr:nucleotidyltransferase family protein [Vicinamibacterales bacterium]
MRLIMVVGIILAAGASARMGRPKALLPIGGDTFVTRVCRTLVEAGVGDLVVVVGAEHDAIAAAVDGSGLRARVVENPRREEGQLSSVLTGLAVADRPGVDALLVHLVDAPLVRPDTVRAVLDAFLRTHAPIVRPAVGDRHGHPVLFARRLFDELRRADPAVGAKAVVQAHASEVCNVAVDDEGACRDIDTPEDFARLAGPSPAHQRGEVGRLAVHEQPNPEDPRREP